MKKSLIKVIVLLVIVALFAVLGVSGCEAATTATTAAVETTAAAAETTTTAAAETTTIAPAKKLVFVDTNSGANFQLFFNEKVIPEAASKLGIDVEYVVSSGPEIVERMKAWGSDQEGDIHFLLLKQDTLGDMFKNNIAVLKVYPDLTSKVPNITKISKQNLEVNDAVQLDGKAALFWRSQMAICYDSTKIPNPPKSWKEFYERREEFKGHIGMLRADAKSSGGRRMIYGFLNAFGVDFKKPYAELKESKEWKDAWVKFEEFSKYFFKPLASEPPILYQQFKSGDVWITEYALDYTLWSRDQGLLPESVKGLFFQEGDTSGADALLVIPEKIGAAEKESALIFMNFLLSDETQIDMITTMWQYTGTDIEDKIPASVWDNIPKWSVAEKSRIKFENADAQTYIMENGDSHIK